MSKSLLYASNNAIQTIASTTPQVINFGSIVRRYGCNANLTGGNATIKGSGYYEVDVNVVFTDTLAGTVFVTLYKDGVAIPGAVSSISVVAGDVDTFRPFAIVRHMCDCESTITAEISGVTGTISSASIAVEKL